jgi:hypothetical protein
MRCFNQNEPYRRLIPKGRIRVSSDLIKRNEPTTRGGGALLWEEGHKDFEFNAVNIVSLNPLMFQLVTGEDRYFVMGAHIPPANMMGVDDLPNAWAARPTNNKPLLLGDLNIDFRTLRTKREEIIADFLDNINIVDMTVQVHPAQGKLTGTGGTVDLVEVEGRLMVHLADSHHGPGDGFEGFLRCGIFPAAVSRFRSLHRRRHNFEGMESMAQEIPVDPPDVPPATPTGGVAGWGHKDVWGIEGGMQGDGSGKSNAEQLDLKRDVAANCLLGNAPLCRPPLPKRGASSTPTNWSLSLCG